MPIKLRIQSKDLYDELVVPGTIRVVSGGPLSLRDQLGVLIEDGEALRDSEADPNADDLRTEAAAIYIRVLNTLSADDVPQALHDRIRGVEPEWKGPEVGNEFTRAQLSAWIRELYEIRDHLPVLDPDPCGHRVAQQIRGRDARTSAPLAPRLYGSEPGERTAATVLDYREEFLMAEGIEERHKRDCRGGGRCNCRPSFRASVWLPREGKKVKKTFPTKAAAKAWRHDAMVARERGELTTPAKRKLSEAAEAWLEGARAGTVHNRSGDPYKPSAIRGYEKALRLRVLPVFGNVKLSELRRIDLQDFVDGLVADGLSPSTIDSTLNPVRAIYRYAIARNEISDGLNPTRNLDTPAIRSQPSGLLTRTRPGSF